MIDSHAHLTCDPLYKEIDILVERAKKAGLTKIVNICTDPLTLERGVAYAKKEPMIVNVGSTTPHDVEKEGEECFPLFEKHARAGDFVAIGETGLDYYYQHADRSVQQHFLRRYLRLAGELSLPVVIHCRDAFDDFLSILKKEFNGQGILHCFTGTMQEAYAVLDQGFYISFSGIVTFKRSEELQKVAKMVPIERLLIETDAPYLAPHPNRGKQNEPAFLTYTAAFLAHLKGISQEELAEITARNADEVFG